MCHDLFEDAQGASCWTEFGSVEVTVVQLNAVVGPANSGGIRGIK